MTRSSRKFLRAGRGVMPPANFEPIFFTIKIKIMRNPIITYEWNHKLFSSQSRLNELASVGAIKVDVVSRHQYGCDYSYSTNDDQFIASYYKDDTFGHGSQATGIELKHAIPDCSYLYQDASIDHENWKRTGSIRKTIRKENFANS